MSNCSENGTNCSTPVATDDIYIDAGEAEHFEKGPTIGPDGKYNMPVDTDLHDYTCPTCEREWKSAPDIFVIGEEKIIWVEGKRIPVRRKMVVAFWNILIERFGSFISRDDWVDCSCSDIPDVDMPDASSVNNIISTMRRELRGTNVTLQMHKKLGYRLTTRENALKFVKTEKEQKKREREAYVAQQSRHRITMDQRREKQKEYRRALNRLKWRLSPDNARNRKSKSNGN